jgi:hypothetical protein
MPWQQQAPMKHLAMPSQLPSSHFLRCSPAYPPRYQCLQDPDRQSVCITFTHVQVLAARANTGTAWPRSAHVVNPSELPVGSVEQIGAWKENKFDGHGRATS